jgi:hypothetical protein
MALSSVEMRERITRAAREHADQTGEADHECGDLIDWADQCWSLLTLEQKRTVYSMLEDEVERWLGEED